MRQITWDDFIAFASSTGFTIEAVHAHRAGNQRPRITNPSSQLENTGTNHYLILRGS